MKKRIFKIFEKVDDGEMILFDSEITTHEEMISKMDLEPSEVRIAIHSIDLESEELYFDFSIYTNKYTESDVDEIFNELEPSFDDFAYLGANYNNHHCWHNYEVFLKK